MGRCPHNWHIEYRGENTETIRCVAVCDMCGETGSPMMVDEQLREVQAELTELKARRCETCERWSR